MANFWKRCVFPSLRIFEFIKMIYLYEVQQTVRLFCWVILSSLSFSSQLQIFLKKMLLWTLKEVVTNSHVICVFFRKKQHQLILSACILVIADPASLCNKCDWWQIAQREVQPLRLCKSHTQRRYIANITTSIFPLNEDWSENKDRPCYCSVMKTKQILPEMKK